jgi:uncharacterized membrane protein (UPF0127 family)
MNKKLLIEAAILAGIIVVLFLLSRKPVPNQFPGYEKVTANVGNKNYTLYIADTEEKRVRGLSGSKPLRSDEGMLFVFPFKDRYNFWMKDMNYPLDVVFVDNDIVVTVLKNIDPSTYPNTFTATAPFNKVIELKAGSLDQGITGSSQILLK